MTKKYLLIFAVAGVLVSGGFISAITGDSSTSTSLKDGEIKSTTQVDTKIEINNDAQEDSSAASKDDSQENSSRLLPTVNKATDDTEENSERVLPTVNKRTVEAKVTVRGWDAEKKQAIEDKIKQETEDKPEIDNVSIGEDEVVMDYKAGAKLFGFIPMVMHVNIVADANANVNVHFPWYKFLVSSNASKTKEKLDHVFQNNETNLEFIKSKSPEDRQLEIFLQISAALHEMSKSIIANIKA